MIPALFWAGDSAKTKNDANAYVGSYRNAWDGGRTRFGTAGNVKTYGEAERAAAEPASVRELRGRPPVVILVALQSPESREKCEAQEAGGAFPPPFPRKGERRGTGRKRAHTSPDHPL